MHPLRAAPATCRQSAVSCARWTIDSAASRPVRCPGRIYVLVCRKPGSVCENVERMEKQCNWRTLIEIMMHNTKSAPTKLCRVKCRWVKVTLCVVLLDKQFAFRLSDMHVHKPFACLSLKCVIHFGLRSTNKTFDGAKFFSLSLSFSRKQARRRERISIEHHLISYVMPYVLFGPSNSWSYPSGEVHAATMPSAPWPHSVSSWSAWPDLGGPDSTGGAWATWAPPELLFHSL